MNIKKQKGYWSDGKDWTGFLILLGLICAVVGWGTIEGILWILSHINIGWV